VASGGGVTPELPFLWQIRFSHFNEKARWALDYKRIAHQRRSTLPGIHVARARRLWGEDTFPVLVLDGEAIGDSAKIVDAVERRQPDPPLYPENETDRDLALDLQDWLGAELGPHIRRYLFFHLLPHTRFAARTMTEGIKPPASAAYRASFPLVRVAMRRAMAIDAEGAAEGWRRTLLALDRIEEELGPSGYLVSDSFTVADLTAAALMFPLVRPEQAQYPIPNPWPEPIESDRASIAKRPGFRYVEEMWRRHRGTSAEVSA
jgi:glutathione S-transferase